MPRLKRKNKQNEDVLRPIAKKLKLPNDDVGSISNIEYTEDKDTTVEVNEIAVLPDIANKLLDIELALCKTLQNLKFAKPVEYIYNPLEYASEVHAMYIRKYCCSLKKILFLGMNPGPWGMSQTGVPFGEITAVRDWLKISGPVGKPHKEQPDRKITGFDCTRSEVSGKRFWALFQQLCGNPENFFRHAFMYNYCPLALMDTKGRNITPADIKGHMLTILQNACDKALIEILKLLKVEILVGIGKFAEKRAQTALKTSGLRIKLLSIPHPSPRAVGNENWIETAKAKLEELGLIQYFSKE